MPDPGRDERLAVVDLGSNSFRLVVFTENPPRGPGGSGWWRRTDEIYEPVRIGAGVDESGALGKEGMRRAAAAIGVFAHFAQASGIGPQDVDAVATSAIREATNARAFLRGIEKRTGLPVRVLSREDEARYGYLAAVNSSSLHDGLMLDLGGGSMQLVEVRGRRAERSDSWQLGAVRMTERFLPGPDPVGAKSLARLRDHVARKLAEAPWLGDAGPQLVGVGGTVRNLGVAIQRVLEVPRFGVQGFRIPREALGELVERLAGMTVAERRGVEGIKPARGDIILAGALVVHAVLEHTGVDELEVTEAGLREGVFFERHLAGRDEPLFDDVRRESVVNLRAQYDPAPVHVDHVAHLALQLFDTLAARGVHDGDAAERELLWAAAMLHDIGVAVDYDDHHKHSRYLVLNAGLPGYAPREVALIGQMVRYHRKGTPSPGPFAALMRKGDAAALDRCAVLLRIAEGLERGRDQVVHDTRVSLRKDGTVHLKAVADGDAPVARWAAAREVELFERAFGRPLVVG